MTRSNCSTIFLTPPFSTLCTQTGQPPLWSRIPTSMHFFPPFLPPPTPFCPVFILSFKPSLLKHPLFCKTFPVLRYLQNFLPCLSTNRKQLAIMNGSKNFVNNFLFPYKLPSQTHNKLKNMIFFFCWLKHITLLIKHNSKD